MDGAPCRHVAFVYVRR
ncbi:hypothetical protein [Duncaniella freteri]